MSKILIADDHAMVRAGLRQFLTEDRSITEIGEAASGNETLDQLRSGSWDLVILDINMPAMDGIEFLRQLKTIEGARGTPVVIVTTEGSESRVVEALSIGAKGYIRKPFTPDQIKERVSPLLEVLR